MELLRNLEGSGYEDDFNDDDDYSSDYDNAEEVVEYKTLDDFQKEQVSSLTSFPL
jgi:hypothetical protein